MSKKYAGLPDLDAAPEIYETPELTDDASTIQTGTQRTVSPDPSDEGHDDSQVGLDRQRIDQDRARQRFEPSVVNAKNVNFSDSIARDRQSYITTTRRRRKPGIISGSLDDEDDDYEEESLTQKIARLRREAEEVRLELEMREEDEFQDASEEQHNEIEKQVKDLKGVLDGFQTGSGTPTTSKAEQNLLRQLASDPSQSQQPTDVVPQKDRQVTSTVGTENSTITAIASFSDRLTALENALGSSGVHATTEKGSILPTLSLLSTQIGALSSTITPSINQPLTSRANATSSIPAIDGITSRVRALTAEADKLTEARKAALQSLQHLHEGRLRSAQSSYGHQRQASVQLRELNEQAQAQARHESQLFLEEQSTKINALYQTIPTIQSLHPLLPTVLERLKSLSVIHAGAANAKLDMDEIESRQEEIDEDIKKWREGLNLVARGMKEHDAVLQENTVVIGDMVRRVEERLKNLQSGQQ